METVDLIINKVIGWIDQLFGFFGFYSERYSQLFMWALVLFVGAKVFKIKLGTSVNLGKKHK